MLSVRRLCKPVASRDLGDTVKFCLATVSYITKKYIGLLFDNEQKGRIWIDNYGPGEKLYST